MFCYSCCISADLILTGLHMNFLPWFSVQLNLRNDQAVICTVLYTCCSDSAAAPFGVYASPSNVLYLRHCGFLPLNNLDKTLPGFYRLQEY